MIEIIVAVIVTLFFCGYLYVRHSYGYWKRQGIQYVEPEFPYGNIRDTNIKESLKDFTTRIYMKTKDTGSMTGIFTFLRPAIVANDLDFIKTVLVKDFHAFVNRGVYYNEKSDPMSAHLFAVDSDKWGPVRKQVTPIFTTGKMKFMFPTITKTASILVSNLNLILQEPKEMEIKDFVIRFTTDVIGAVAFGIECNSFIDPTSMFRVLGTNFFQTPLLLGLSYNFANYYPELARMLGFKALHKESTDFFTNIIRQTIEYREKNATQRNDFMHLLMQIKNKGESGNPDENTSITMAELEAHAFIFFLGGFETSSATMSFALYELSINQEIQEKARQNVKDVLKKHDGEYTYEAIQEMKYLEQVVNETLRKYSPMGAITRTTTKTYVEEKTGAVFPKGMFVFIPAHGIHYDPSIYPDPDVFDPDRFTEENIQSRHPMSFLPFGEGPRHCIGVRFGMIQAKVGLSHLLANFKFTPSTKTEVPLTFDPQTTILQTLKGVWMNVEKL